MSFSKLNFVSVGDKKIKNSVEGGVEEQARNLMTEKLSLKALEDESPSAVVAAVQKRAKDLSNQASSLNRHENGTEASKQIQVKVDKLCELINQEQLDSLTSICRIHQEHPLMESLLDELTQSTSKKRELFFKMCVNGYAEIMDVLNEVGGDREKVPSWEKILLALTPEVLLKVLFMNKPTLLITPNNSFEDKISAMNRNKKFVSKEGLTQTNTYVRRGEGSPFENVDTPIKNIISIVDGQPQMPHIEGIAEDSPWGERRAAFREYYAKKGMKLITVHEAVVLEQLSLQAYKTNNNDESEIVDCNYPRGTLSCLNEEYLRDSASVAYSFFRADFRRVYFNAYDPGFAFEDLRGRPSVPFLEY